MKRLIALLLTVTLALSLAACGTGQKPAEAPNTSTDTSNNNTEAPEQIPEASSQTMEEPAQPEVPQTDPPAEAQDAPEKSVLIVFFTPANSDTADAVSSATPRVGDVSSVEYVAQLIAAQVDADMAKIVPTDAYPLPYNDAADQAKRERDNGDRPSFTLDVNPEDYDTIFIGYPLWWYELPMILQTFFESYDFSGKTLIPFNTHGGSRDSGTYEYIAALEPNATVLDGLAVSGDRAGKAADDVADWLARLGY